MKQRITFIIKAVYFRSPAYLVQRFVIPTVSRLEFSDSVSLSNILRIWCYSGLTPRPNLQESFAVHTFARIEQMSTFKKYKKYLREIESQDSRCEGRSLESEFVYCNAIND